MNRTLYTLALSCALGALFLAACGGDDRPPDTGTIRFDGGPGTDGTVPPRDTGPRADVPTGPACDVGEPCTMTRGCRRSPFCIEEFDGEVGGAEDPIEGLPGGGNGFPVTVWLEGYCTTVGEDGVDGCNPLDDESCGGLECAACFNTGQVSMASGNPITYCLQTCTASLTSNPCREEYTCALGNNVCVPGCTQDNECRLRREDTNMNGFIDPIDPMTNPTGDGLVYDASANGTCDLTTYRCRHDGTAGAEAGDTCMGDFDCEANGDCITPGDPMEGGTWPGGYCTKFGCDVAGNSCAGMGKCQERGIGIPLCVQACEVAATTDDMPYSPSRDCRAGYSCFWDGSGGAGMGNGGCVPGNYNAIRASNTGEACADETECNSPFGLGQCRDFGGGNHCTLFDCSAPGIPTDVCGDPADALCAMVSGSTTTLCMQRCTTANDCGAMGHGCWDTTMAGISTGGQRVCFPGCLVDGDCRTGQTCEGATAMMVGECM